MKTRVYEQQARFESAQVRTEAILKAGMELFMERPFAQITLSAVAVRAGVGLQTVIRRVHTKDGLVQAITAWNAAQIEGVRGTPGPDPEAVADALMDFYERWGEGAWRMIRQEDASPALTEAAEQGRANHRRWIEENFASLDADRIARLVGICGVELWLVLRRDLSAEATRDAVRDLIAATLERKP